MHKVLIVEDDLMIADCLEEFLTDAGYVVCGIACDVTDGIRLGRQHAVDLAVIDVRLAQGGYGTDVAAALCRDDPSLGVLYVSGNIEIDLLTGAHGVGCLAKPYTESSILAALSTVRDIMSTPLSVAIPPHGFRRLNTRGSATH